MIEQPTGPLRVFNVTQSSGAGGNITCDVRPPEGEAWDCRVIRATHDDAAGLAVTWKLKDAIGPIDQSGFGATAVPRYFNNDHYCSGAVLRLHHNCYVGFYVAGMAGAKTITVTVMAERILGLPLMEAA